MNILELNITILCNEFFKNDMVEAVDVFLEYQELIENGFYTDICINLKRWGSDSRTHKRFYRPMILIERNGCLLEKEWNSREELDEIMAACVYKETA